MTAAVVGLLDLPVNTIGDLYVISSALPAFQMPDLSYETVSAVLPDAFTIAVLAAIESLLSAVVADEMIGSRHNSNMELVAQGVGNSASALFGGIPATGACLLYTSFPCRCFISVIDFFWKEKYWNRFLLILAHPIFSL